MVQQEVSPEDVRTVPWTSVEGENQLSQACPQTSFVSGFVLFWDGVLLCSTSCSGTHYVDQVKLKVRDLLCFPTAKIKGVHVIWQSLEPHTDAGLRKYQLTFDKGAEVHSEEKTVFNKY